MNTPMPGPHGRPAQVAPPVPASARPRTGPLGWFTRGGWYLFVVVLSAGTLSFVPFLHAAIRTRKPPMWLWTVLYTAAVVTLFTLTGTPNTGGLIVGLTIIAAVHSVVLRHQVWPPDANAQPAPAGLNNADSLPDPAVAAVLAARARRDEARRLAAADPQMARELRIGRPDLPRAYDDGGLVDLNSAPPAAIANTCGIETAAATLIVNGPRSWAHLHHDRRRLLPHRPPVPALGPHPRPCRRDHRLTHRRARPAIAGHLDDLRTRRKAGAPTATCRPTAYQ